MADYKIKLDLLQQEPDKYGEMNVGSITPINPVSGEKGTASDAFLIQQIPYRAGIWAAYESDRAMRAFSQSDDMVNKDPSFDPFTVWKEGGHNPEEIDAIMDMDNWDQYNLYQEIKDYEERSYAAYDDAGGLTKAAIILSSIVTDPTIYAGYGAVRMVSAGVSKRLAYSAAAAAGMATTEAVEQAIDITEKRSLTDSAINIAAASVIGGVLGEASVLWGKKSAQGKLKAKSNDFHEASMDYVVDAATMTQRADYSVNAMFNPEGAKSLDDQSLILGKGAKAISAKMRYLSPKLIGQTAKEGETRRLYDQILGRNLKTASDAAGFERIESVNETWVRTEIGYMSEITDYADEMTRLKKAGEVLDEAGEERAILLNADANLNPDSPSIAATAAERTTAKKLRKFFKSWDKEFIDTGMQGYATRSDFGAPVYILANKVNKNVSAFAENVILKGMKRAKASAIKEENAIRNQISQLESLGGNKSDILDLYDELKNINWIANASEEELLEEALVTANAYAQGLHEGVSGVRLDKLMPGHFRQRFVKLNDVIPFMETNPVKLMGSYTREMSPFLASQKVLGDKTPYKAIADYEKSMLEKIASSADQKQKDLLTRELEQTKRVLMQEWKTMTGETSAEFRDLVGAPIMNAVTTARNYISMISLGNRVTASLGDLSAVATTRGLSGVGGFTKVLFAMATSKEFRQISRKTAAHFSAGLDNSIHSILGERIGDDLFNADITRRGFSGKAAAASQWANNKSQIINGAVGFDTIVRRGLAIAQQGFIKDSIDDLVKGKAKDWQVTDLAFLGISESNASSIKAQLDKHGSVINKVFMSNVDKWDDAAARNAFELAVFRDNRRVSLQPGVGDTPHIMRAPGANLLFMFKSWGITATQVYGLSALQRSDSRHLMNITTLIGLASLADMFDAKVRGNEIETDPEELIWAGVTRSGMIGVLPEVGGSALMNKLFDIQSGGGRLYEYAELPQLVGGPMGGVLADIGTAVKPIGAALDAQEDADFNDAWAKSLVDLVPAPFVKPLIKKQITEE